MKIGQVDDVVAIDDLVHRPMSEPDADLWVVFKHSEYIKLQAENAKLRELVEEFADMQKCEECEAMLDCDECLRADSSQKERKRVDYKNAKLRELVKDMATEMRGLGVDFTRVGWCDYTDRMRELGVEV